MRLYKYTIGSINDLFGKKYSEIEGRILKGRSEKICEGEGGRVAVDVFII